MRKIIILVACAFLMACVPTYVEQEPEQFAPEPEFIISLVRSATDEVFETWNDFDWTDEIMSRVANYIEDNQVWSGEVETVKIRIYELGDSLIFGTEIEPFIFERTRWHELETGDRIELDDRVWYVYKDGEWEDQNGLAFTLEPGNNDFVDVILNPHPYNSDYYVFRVKVNHHPAVYLETGRQIEIPIADNFLFFDIGFASGYQWFDYYNSAEFREFVHEDGRIVRYSMILLLIDGVAQIGISIF